MTTGYDLGDTRISVNNGGGIDVASGGDIDIASGGALKLAGDTITSNATEINQLDGITTLATDFVGDITYTINDQAGDDRNIDVQLKDQQGTNMAIACVVWWHISDVATGIGISAGAPSGGVAIGDNGEELAEVTADLCGFAITTAGGALDITLTETSTATWYLFVQPMQGAGEVSAAIAFS